jgi:hypothetical protein
LSRFAGPRNGVWTRRTWPNPADGPRYERRNRIVRLGAINGEVDLATLRRALGGELAVDVTAG